MVISGGAAVGVWKTMICTHPNVALEPERAVHVSYMLCKQTALAPKTLHRRIVCRERTVSAASNPKPCAVAHAFSEIQEAENFKRTDYCNDHPFKALAHVDIWRKFQSNVVPI